MIDFWKGPVIISSTLIKENEQNWIFMESNDMPAIIGKFQAKPSPRKLS